MDTTFLPFDCIAMQDAARTISGRGHMLLLADHCGFCLCQRGWADVSLNDQSFHLSEGDIYIYMPSTFVALLEHSADLEGIIIKCRLDFVLPLMEKFFSGDTILSMRNHPHVSLSPAQRQSLEGLVRLVRERRNLLVGGTLDAGAAQIVRQLVLSLGESLFHELLYDYACNQSFQPQVHDKHDHIFQTFLVSLFKNYKREREVAFYAAEQCLTPRYFSSVIKEKSGHSALQWIIQMVISSVRQTLTVTDLSIKEIAMDFNFPTQSFFGKYFKQYVGVSPREYRLQERARLKA